MKDASEILELEEKYKKALMNKLSGDERYTLSSPDFKYPEPLFVYIKSAKADKTIAVRLDGGDGTMHCWDYIDDDYSDENGVWGKMTEGGLESFVKKLTSIMDKAIDIEFFALDGECEDYYSGVANFPFTAENARLAVKKTGKDVDFAFAKFSNFYGDVQFVFDKNFRQVVK